MLVQMDIPASRSCLTGALEGLVGVNYAMMTHRSFPSLYDSGVRYRAEKRTPGKPEKWLNVEQVYAKRFADCEDLACIRAAELRKKGIPARAVVLRSGPKTFHAVVLWPSGEVEDPSVILGMKKRRRK